MTVTLEDLRELRVAEPVAQWIAWRIRLAAIEAYLKLSGDKP